MSNLNQDRYDAYHYGFDSTGNPDVDGILRAVARAGKAYHHTENWGDEDCAVDGRTHETIIQEAANQAAAEIEAAITAAEKRGYDSGLVKSLTIADCYQRGQRDMLAKCIAAVESLHHDAATDTHSRVLWDAICELRALQEKP